ncbi:phosphatidylserine decarboxylase [Helicobacter mesocricetorum]|uniref:hypothetical protein n=1 Tax=Helicobacter mesocricetorum TaxID=87012 RepID=UPI000CF0B841|nr:hypothetical protein [Helicobacter mesocricetorum]
MRTTTEIIAREGWKALGIGASILLISWLFSWGFLAWLAFIFLLGALYCYYNPERIPEDMADNLILSPIDGKVESIEKTDNAICLEISKPIYFCGLLRMPFEGNAKEKEKIYGVLNASPTIGERTLLEFFHTHLGIKVQMLIYPKSYCHNLHLYFGESKFKIAERIGFFLKGSVKIDVPLNTELKVSVGDRIFAGCSALGYVY